MLVNDCKAKTVRAVRLQAATDAQPQPFPQGLCPDCAQRFWSRVEKGPGCWNWLGTLDGSGYGQINIGGRHWQAHRLAWALTVGTEPESWLLHDCDNRRCCNPAHLHPGDRRQNMRECRDRGRLPLARLTRAEVDKIQSNRFATDAQIAAYYGMTRDHIRSIRLGRRWAPQENLL